MTMQRAGFFGLLAGLSLSGFVSCGPAAKCDATTCSTGCCDASGQCRPGGEVDACGAGGRVCIACQGTQRCEVGACTGTGVTGGGTGGGGGALNFEVTLNEIATSDGDFFELMNTSDATVDLSGFKVADLDGATNGPKLTGALTLPAGTTLAPGALLLFTEGMTAGPSTSCGSAQVTSCFTVTFGLSAGNGDSVFLVDSSGATVMRGDAPPNAHPGMASYGRLPDGTGSFQVTARTPGLPNQPFAPVDAGTQDAGLPDAGVIDGGMTLPDGGAPSVVFNEVAVSNGDFFELLNVSGQSVDLSGFKVADLDGATGGPKLAEAVTLPAGTTLAPGAFLLFYEGTTCGPASSCINIPFGLSGNGEALFLLSAGDAVELRFDIPATPHGANLSRGRMPDGTGPFVETARTPGAPNALVAAPDAGVEVDAGVALAVTFNEVAVSNGDFFELLNLGAAVDLSGFKVADLDGTTNGPKLSDAVTLPAGTTLAGGARLLFYEGATCGPASSCLNFGFGLSGNGEALFLLSANDAVVLRLDVPASSHAANRSWGRIPDGTGAFVETARTPGDVNALFVTPDAGTSTDAGVDARFVVVRIGPAADGGALSGASAAVTLEWRSLTTGAVVSSVALPTVTNGAQRAFALSGSASSDGLLARGAASWTLAGYGVTPGTSGVVSAAGLERVVAWVGDDGGLDTSTAFTNAYEGNNVRAAVTTDGTGFWTAGTSSLNGGVRYAGRGAPTSVEVYSGVTNLRAVKVFEGQLYASTASDAGAGVPRIFSVGAGLPQATTAMTGPLTGVTMQNASDFVLLDRQAPTGPDTLYVADTASGVGVRGFAFNGAAWVETSSLRPPSGTCLSVAAQATATGAVVICATTGAIYRWNDDGLLADGGSPEPQLVTNSAAGTTFRGVGFE